MLCMNEATKKLFKAIDFQSVSDEVIIPEEDLSNFKQALEEGANVNAFEDGMTPLMLISLALSSSNAEEQSKLELMAKLLVQHENIDINIKSEQAVIKTILKKYKGYPVYTFGDKEVVDRGEDGCVYRDSWQPVDEGFIPSEVYNRAKDDIDTGNKKEDTALHIACQFGAINMVRILLTHPDIKTNIKNYENKSPKDCIAEHAKKEIEPEFLKAEAATQKRKQTNYAYASLLLSGALTAGVCLTVYNPVIYAPLAAAALLFFAIGCCCLYKASTALNNVDCFQIGCEHIKMIFDD